MKRAGFSPPFLRFYGSAGPCPAAFHRHRPPAGHGPALPAWRQRASAAVAGICEFARGRTPFGEVGSTITMVSLDPSGHTTWKVLPAGNDENGTPLCAR